MEQNSEKSKPPQLSKELLDGSHAALSAFVKEWERSILNIAYRIVGQIADAEDIRQDVLLKIISKPLSLTSAHNIGAWIRRCTINEAVSWLRKAKRRRQIASALPDDFPSPFFEDRNSSDEQLRLWTMLSEIDPNVRALLALRFDEGLTVREIGEVVCLPTSTVHSQLQSAIKQLRANLNIHPTEP